MKGAFLIGLGLAACADDAPTSDTDASKPDTADSDDTDAPTCPVCPPSPSPCVANECDKILGICHAVSAAEGAACDRDDDPMTIDTCDARGVCQPPEPPPPPVSCGAIVTTLACGAVATPVDGLVDTMRNYTCDPEPLPGGELVFAFSPASDGVVAIDIDAEPRAYVRTLILSLTCDVASCTDGPSAAASRTLPVTAGRDYFIVVDAIVGGVVELASLTLTCSAGEVCDNLHDDDFDTIADCADPDCGSKPPCESPESTCGDTFDNDGDGYSDCADRDCDKSGFCQFGTETTCADAYDNDADGDDDCDDTDCWADPACLVPCATIARPVTCGDTFTQVEAGPQAFAAHPCAPGDWRVPEVVFTFAPTTTGTATLGLATLHTHAAIFVYPGACETATACKASALVPPTDFSEPLAFAFEAGLTYTVVVDATPVDGVVGPGLALDRFRLRCE